MISKIRFIRLFCFIILLISLVATELHGQETSFDSLHTEWGTITFHPREKGLAESTSRKIAQTIQNIEDVLNLKQITSFHVIIAPTKQDFQNMTGALPDWTAGVTDYRNGRITLQSPKAGHTTMWDYDETTRHEVVHMILGQHVDTQRLPRWLNEGYAMALSGQHTLSQMYTLTQAVLRDQLIPLGDIEQVLQFSQSRAHLAYAEAYSAVRFFRKELPSATLNQIIDSLNGSPVSFDQALEKITGLNTATFEYHWKQELQTQHRWITMLSSETVLWILFPLLALAAYLAIRWRNAKKMRSWQEEEDVIDSNSDWEFEYMPDEDEKWRGDKH